MSQLTLNDPPGQRVSKTFPKPAKRRPLVIELLESPIALKWIMALSGIVGLSFVLVHMIGNFHVFEGPEGINSYALALRDLGGDLFPRGGVLWIMRFGLIAAVLVHGLSAYRLTVVNHRARPVKYQSKRDYIAADFAGRTMRITGVWLILFILYHLADLTWGEGITRSHYIEGDVYNNLVWSLSRPSSAAFYILSMAALSFHLYHGTWSLFQSLGASSPRYNSARRVFATGFALVILCGNVAVVLAINTGAVNQDNRCWPTPEQVDAKEAEIAGTQFSNSQIQEVIDAGACPFQGDYAAVTPPIAVVPDVPAAPVPTAPAGSIPAAPVPTAPAGSSVTTPTATTPTATTPTATATTPEGAP